MLTQQEFEHKANNLIQDNKFTVIKNNPTKHFQETIKQTLKQCNNILQKETVWRYTSMNPAFPNLRATIKLHKPNTPIRPLINWKNVPTYELAKHLTQTLPNYLHLLVCASALYTECFPGIWRFSNEQYSANFQLKANLLTENYRSRFAFLCTLFSCET
jgi:hypothetical protein